MKRFIALSLLFCAVCFAQVYVATVTEGGTGYVSAPAVTASGGNCTASPTFVATVASGAVNSVLPTFAGTNCSGTITLAFSGPGTGASATASLLPATELILSAVPTSSQVSILPTVGGQYTAWTFLCWLTVPATRVPFFATLNAPFRMPGTSQISAMVPALVPGFSINNTGPNIVAALGLGIFTEYEGTVFTNSTNPITTAEPLIVTSCATQQANLNAWDPWNYYGSYYTLAGAWGTQGYN